MRGRWIDRWWAWSVVVGTVALTALTAAAGAASASAVGSQDTYARLIVAAAEVPDLAGRIESAVAGIADPRTNPARLDQMRQDVAGSAARLRRLGVALEVGDPGVGVTVADAATLRAQFDGGGLLPGEVARFAEQAGRAAVAGADVAPGSLLRADLDGEYPDLLALSESLTSRVQVAVADQRNRWGRLVGLAVAGPGLVGAVVAVFVLGPVARARRRQVDQQQELACVREDAAAYVEQLLDGLDVAVVAIDTAGSRVTVNAAARALIGLAARGPVALDDVLSKIDLRPAVDAAAEPVGLRPLALALRGQAVTGEFVLVPRGFSQANPKGNPRQAAARGPDARLRQVAVQAAAVRAADGRTLGAVLTLQDLTDLQMSHRALTRHAEQLEAIGRATTAVLREDDARAAVCLAAATVSRAVVASLFEPDGHGDLVCTAAHGADLLGLRMPADGRSVIARAFATAVTVTTDDMAGNLEVDRVQVARLTELCGQDLTSAAWIPVVDHGSCVAVLTLGLAADAEDVADHLDVLEIIASEAAVALQRQTLLRRLAVQAERDGLTGAANRRVWEDRLPRALDAARSSGQPLAVVILDLDHFKAYNDRHGHPAGDDLLRGAVQVWQQRLRPDDLLARYGGEEFAVLLPGCTLQDAQRVADDLRRRTPGGQTCSAGVAQWSGAEHPAELVNRADQALYAAKHDGRNLTAVASGPIVDES